MRPGSITVVIPSIPPRVGLLERALRSALAQTRQPDALSVHVDHERYGAPTTRNRALAAARTEWVAFLDDDDEFMPHHLEALLGHAETTGADYVYSWFETAPPGCDPFPVHHFTNEFDPTDPIQTTITILVRRDLAREVHGFRLPPEGATIGGQRWGEDYQFTLDCVAAGAKIRHLVERTWIWHHHGRNTSGRADAW